MGKQKTDNSPKPFDRRGDFMLLTVTKPGVTPFWVRMSSIERVYPWNTERTKLAMASGQELVVYENAGDILAALAGGKENNDAVQGQKA